MLSADCQLKKSSVQTVCYRTAENRLSATEQTNAVYPLQDIWEQTVCLKTDVFRLSDTEELNADFLLQNIWVHTLWYKHYNAVFPLEGNWVQNVIQRKD